MMTAKFRINRPKQKYFFAITLIVILLSQSGCFFFRKKSLGKKNSEFNGAVLGKPLGEKANGPDSEQLKAIYAISTDHAPAGIRPDPDTYIRTLLLQHRDEGTTVAKEIGRVDAYRILLGGASEDFAKVPQETYDATSLLASMAVATEICESLVDPKSVKHPGWSTILPEKANHVDENIRFLAQRFLGIHSTDVSDEVMDSLVGIFDEARDDGDPELGHYIPVCTALALDAEALLL